MEYSDDNLVSVAYQNSKKEGYSGSTVYITYQNNKKRITSNKTHLRKREELPKGFSKSAAEKVIKKALQNERFVNFLKSNINEVAPEIIEHLSEPVLDEYILKKINSKREPKKQIRINVIRSSLNKIQELGFVNYKKNSQRNWEFFYWYINISKLERFLKELEEQQSSKKEQSSDSSCNDFYTCEKCNLEYGNKLKISFDKAYDQHFRCEICGSLLTRIED
ncbi:MAG: transcription factor E [Candidatus Micrarchaeota archaeon]|nr:MAG: transcription factor E [Candidatus Micrarchaeota archaeon]